MSEPAPGRFDFGLNGEQEARAVRLHKDSIVIDLLSQHAGGAIFAHYSKRLQQQFSDSVEGILAKQSPMEALAEIVYWPYELSRRGESDLLRDWLIASGLTCGTYGIEVHDGGSPVVNRWESLALRYKDLPWHRYVTTAREIRQAKKDGIIASYAHAQPEYPAPRNLGAIDIAYEKGLRSFMLTYNRMDNIGVGCTERVDAGLSMYGVDVVKHCNKIGMIVDVSHCGHLTTIDACRLSKKPVNANHTAAQSVHSHARGKHDDALKAIAGTGGVIGVVALPAFVSGEENPTIECTLNHMDYISSLVGWQHVAIGTDWPLQIPDDLLLRTLGIELGAIGFREADKLDVTKRLNGFNDCRDLPNITRGLVKRGYSDEQIRGILGENALRVFLDVWGA